MPRRSEFTEAERRERARARKRRYWAKNKQSLNQKRLAARRKRRALTDAIGAAGSPDELLRVLARHRQALGIPQRELDDIAGFAEGQISKYEIGKGRPRRDGQATNRLVRSSGREPGLEMLMVWLKSLGLQIVLTKDPEAPEPKTRQQRFSDWQETT